MNTIRIISKISSFRTTLCDYGVGYGTCIEQLNLLVWMEDECAGPPCRAVVSAFPKAMTGLTLRFATLGTELQTPLAMPAMTELQS